MVSNTLIAGTLARVSKSFHKLVSQCLSEASSITPCNVRDLGVGRGCACLTSLLQHSQPRSMDLRTCHSWLTAASIRSPMLASDLSLLHTLTLDNCSKLGASGLKALSLCGCGDIGDGSSLRPLRALTHLQLDWCYTVTTAGVLPILAQLQVAGLHGCSLLDDTMCASLLLVGDLDISFSLVTDFGLLQLAASSTCLKKLTLADLDVVNVWTCALYTEHGLAEMKRLRPDVKQCLVFV
ncbi:MAG: hypothetical protein WDW38_004297 [Sanguina aurantia]